MEFSKQKKLKLLKNFLAVPQGMWNLRSLTWNGTHTPCNGSADCQGSPSKQKFLLKVKTKTNGLSSLVQLAM